MTGTTPAGVRNTAMTIYRLPVLAEAARPLVADSIPSAPGRAAARLAAALPGLAGAQSAAPRPDQLAFRALYKELVETNTTLSVGSCTKAAEAMAARLKAAGYPDSDLHLIVDPAHPREGNLVAVLPGTDPKAKAVLLLAHIDVVAAKREDWVRDPFTLIANLFLAQLFLGLPHLNRVAWSACSEMWMPGFLAFGAWLGRKQGKAILWTLLLLMWALGGFSLGDNGIKSQHLIDLLRSFAGLSAGFLLCMLFPAPAVEPERPSPTLIPRLLLLAVILIMALGRKFGFIVYAFPATAGFAIIGFLRTKTFLSGRVCQFLGARSYAIYMIHWPVLLIFSSYFGPDGLKGNVVIKLAIIISSLLLADLVHRYVELPFLRLRDVLMPIRT